MTLRRPALSVLGLLASLAATVALLALGGIFAQAAPARVVEESPGAVAPSAPAHVPAPGVAIGWPAAADLPEPVRPEGSEVPQKKKTPAFTTARVLAGRTVTLYSRPGRAHDVVARVGSVSEFGSPKTFSVVERRGRWLGVVAPELDNGQVGWMDLRAGDLDLGRTRMSVSIDLSRRLLVVSRGPEVLRRISVGIGRAGSPTPTGRFAVTDKLPGARYSAVYGCCIVALTAHQPNLPLGWRNGNRVALHGTNDPSTIGVPSSAGCPHASDRDMRYLMRLLPLGTPVVIHP